MKTYLVGGAVRDALMGLPVRDRDWVVVGATPQQMLDLGYTQVGRDFPVFLHPRTKDEYALARTERNTAPGYRGFSVQAGPGVTLEEDLARRDLTINAIALTADHDLGAAPPRAQDLVDPFHGQQDIADKVLRHVTPAFSEDPVRILRLARFAARFADYRVASETMALMRSMVDAGDVDHLVAERVWQELARGLMEQEPRRMFAVLRECGALAHLLPELDHLWDGPAGELSLRAIEAAARRQGSLAVRFACLTHHLGRKLAWGAEGSSSPEAWPGPAAPQDAALAAPGSALLQSLAQRLRAPSDCAELAELTLRELQAVHGSAALDAEGVLALLERCDALRKPERFAELLLVGECDAQCTAGPLVPYLPRPRLAQALQQVLDMPTQELARQAMALGAKGPKIGQAIRHARVHRLAQTLPRP